MGKGRGGGGDRGRKGRRGRSLKRRSRRDSSNRPPRTFAAQREIPLFESPGPRPTDPCSGRESGTSGEMKEVTKVSTSNPGDGGGERALFFSRSQHFLKVRLNAGRSPWETLKRQLEINGGEGARVLRVCACCACVCCNAVRTAGRPQCGNARA